MTHAAIAPCLTPADYREWEERADTKHEYERGITLPMAGGTRNHNRVKLNITTMIDSALDHPGFEVFNSETRIPTPDAAHYFYPDVCAVAGEPLFDPLWETATLLNPCLIIEVVSKTSERRDRGTIDAYRTIPSLREYLVVDPERVHVSQWHTDTNGAWHERLLTDLENNLAFVSIPVLLPSAPSIAE